VAQPLGQNALRQWVPKLLTQGEIRISARQDEKNLHLYITDNGPGLAEFPDHPAREGIGLSATRERLRTLYGEDQSIEIKNAPEGGVEVHLKLPFRPVARPMDMQGIESMSAQSPEQG